MRGDMRRCWHCGKWRMYFQMRQLCKGIWVCADYRAH